MKVVQIWYKRKARPAKRLSLRLCETAKSSIPVAGSNMYGCKLRFYLSLQSFSLFYTFGTNQYNKESCCVIIMIWHNYITDDILVL